MSPRAVNHIAATDGPLAHRVAAKGEPMVIAHLSDPHLSALTGVRLRDLLGKRVLGYLSWLQRRRWEHRREILDALLADLNAQAPDHVVITGDLTHIGLPSEFAEASAWLGSVGAPEDVTVVPGNHDAYVGSPWSATFAQWADYMASDSAFAGDPWFPTLRIRGTIGIIGLSSASPSGPFLATGWVGEEQRHRLAELLQESERAGLFRVVLLHHPPVAGVVGRRKRLTDASGVRGVLFRYGAELVLHGHAHRTSFAELPSRVGAIPVIGARSASAMSSKPGRMAQYHIYRVRRRSTGWEVSVRVREFERAKSRFVEHGRRELDLCRGPGACAAEQPANQACAGAARYP